MSRYLNSLIKCTITLIAMWKFFTYKGNRIQLHVCEGRGKMGVIFKKNVDKQFHIIGAISYSSVFEIMILMSLYVFVYHVFQKLQLFYSSIFVVFHIEHFIDFYLKKIFNLFTSWKCYDYKAKNSRIHFWKEKENFRQYCKMNKKYSVTKGNVKTFK